MYSAKVALQKAIQMLTPSDYFTICAFDHEMIWFQCPVNSSPFLCHANPQSIAIACQWIDSIQASGLTNILTPYQIATSLLSNPVTQFGNQQFQSYGPSKV